MLRKDFSLCAWDHRKAAANEDGQGRWAKESGVVQGIAPQNWSGKHLLLLALIQMNVQTLKTLVKEGVFLFLLVLPCCDIRSSELASVWPQFLLNTEWMPALVPSHSYPFSPTHTTLCGEVIAKQSVPLPDTTNTLPCFREQADWKRMPSFSSWRGKRSSWLEMEYHFPSSLFFPQKYTGENPTWFGVIVQSTKPLLSMQWSCCLWCFYFLKCL